jgi:hypothetical protein
MPTRKNVAPEAAATAPRARYVACGKPTRPDTPGQSPRQSPKLPIAPDNTGGKQAEPERLPATSRPSLRAAIDAKCKSCIYDPGSYGNWREQVSSCSSANCPLHPLRPISGAFRRELQSAGVDHRAGTAWRVHGPKNGLPGPALGIPEGGAA